MYFLIHSMVLQNFQQFMEDVFAGLNKFGIDVSNLEMDHFGYQASSNEDYDNLVPEFKKLGEWLSEEVVGGRRVSIYKLLEPLSYKQSKPQAIELIAPKDGQVCPSALEHVEFVLPDGFENFIQKYPDLPWETKEINQKDFPMIKLRLSEYTQVKFHLKSVLEIIANLKSN
jgi:predicted metalloenzyme YecM